MVVLLICLTITIRGANIADLLIDNISDSIWPGFVHDADVLQLHNRIS